MSKRLLGRDLTQVLRRVVGKCRMYWLAGKRHTCSTCGRSFRRFVGFGRPVRPAARCPGCGALERHRLIALWLNTHAAELNGRTLHCAPESMVSAKLRPLSSEYKSLDLLDETADFQADLTNLPFDDGRWDFVVCSHVLEHIPDDAAAIREIARVLSPGGKALIVVPRRPGVPTDEDPSLPEEQRIARFGQLDHVRMYGDDLEDRLRAPGLSLTSVGADSYPPESRERYGLESLGGYLGTGDAAFVCSKPSSTA
jgi:SAM-dependent methyltransferase